jgi:hypothetical protein
MIERCFVAFLIFTSLGRAIIVDRIAIVAGKRIIKESDIENDLKLTAFLNQELVISVLETRKKSANRLLDQIFIAEQLETGVYPSASVEETQQTLNTLIKSRYPSLETYKTSLARYGLSEEELKARLSWQLTVLRFIDTRFRSSAYITDGEIRDYYEAHRRQFPGDLNASQARIEEILSGERTNKEFYDWLDRRRQQTPIRYVEQALK